MENKMSEKEYLAAASAQASELLANDPDGMGVPLDPDVAEYRGAFEEHAVTLDDVSGAIGAT